MRGGWWGVSGEGVGVGQSGMVFTKTVGKFH